MAKKKYTIMIIDDDPLVNNSVNGILASLYSKVVSYTDCEKALEDLESVHPDLILLDVFLGEMNGLDVLELLKEKNFPTPVIMMTAFSDVKMAVRAVKLGAEDFIIKPLDLEQLEVSVERALTNFDLRRKVNILQEQLETNAAAGEIIAESEPMQAALKMAEMLSRSDDTTVLILGETGTGKELMAKYVHDLSPRKQGPFVSVNCGAIPKDLAENELFGYEKGAFTGATEKVKQGRFEMAHRGTLHLDEVGELSMEMQVKLLRVLQDKKFYRLGGTKEVSCDVRIIAATNRNLEELIEEGKFREDLYYRLNVGTINLPPLRERPGDVMTMASSFVQEFSKKFGKEITGFTPEAVEILTSYEWKGNVRELRNVIERVSLLEVDTVISKSSLSFLKPMQSSSARISVDDLPLQPGEHKLKVSSEGATLSEVVKDLILQTLAITDGNQLKAAKVLGISRAKLRYRLEQLGIKPSNKTVS